MEPERGRGITVDTIQSRPDDGSLFSTSTNQVDINSELLQNLFAHSDGNAPPVVYDQPVTVPSTASSSPKLPSSYDYGNAPPVASDQSEITPSASLSDGNTPLVVSNQAVMPKPEFTHDLSIEATPWTMTSASPRSGPGYLIHDSMFTKDVDWRNPDRTSMSSPPTQNMVHGDGYDPNRIPSSIFSSKPTSTDWSTASNESLFSIYMGNSFSGYQGFSMTGEIGKFEGLNNSQNPLKTFEAKANGGNDFSLNFPTLPETSPEHETQQSENSKDHMRLREGPSKISAAMIEEGKETHGSKTSLEEHLADLTISSHEGELSLFEKTILIPNRLSDESEKSCSSKDRLSNGSSNKSCSSNNILSYESERSFGSFAFPILVDPGKSSSFRMKYDNKVEPPKKQQIEPPQRTTAVEAPQSTSQPVAKEKGCCCNWSFLPGWNCC